MTKLCEHNSHCDCSRLKQLLRIIEAALQAARCITDMPHPRYRGSGHDGENYGRKQGFRRVPNPWQGPEMKSGLTNVNPMALGKLVGAVVGQMAAGGGGDLGALMALQAGQQQGQIGWPHANADRGMRQSQVMEQYNLPTLSSMCCRKGTEKGGDGGQGIEVPW